MFDLSKSVSCISCIRVGGLMVSVLCFADDMMRLAPSWRALQVLIDWL